MTTDNRPIASLTLLDENGGAATVWELKDQKTYSIGRGKKNDITLPYTWISRQHAMIQAEERGTFNIIDMGSSNGTMVNGKRRHAATRLQTGDKIQIGSKKTTLVFFHDYVPETPTEYDDLDEETVAFLQTELITIMVCDIRNFTSLSETIGAEIVSNILTTWSRGVNEIVQKNNGTIDKFIGDAVMATWVGKEQQKDNILSAMRTLLAIQELTTLLSQKLPNLPWPLTVGGAINTGEAVVGNIGVDGGRDFTAVGDAVNVTFRLEELTTKVEVDCMMGPNLTETVPQCAEAFQSYRYVIKGKKDPVTSYGCSFDQLKEFLQGMT